MVHNHKRKTNHASWTENDLQMAIFKCSNGTKIKTATSMYTIPYKTLYKIMNSGKTNNLDDLDPLLYRPI